MSEAPPEVPCESSTNQGCLERSRSDAELLAAAAVPRRRAVLATLRDHGEFAMSDLATHVVAREEGVATDEVTDARRNRALTGLHHQHVPALADTGLVVYQHDEEEPRVGPAVWLADDPTFDAIESAFATGRTDEVVDTLLADSARELVVSILREHEGAFALDDLASAVAAVGRTAGSPPPERAVTSAVASLHHVHLPKLDDVGIVEYDAAERTVEFESVPEIYDLVVEGTSNVAVSDPSE
ncbi:hypothetical protein HUG10_11905 [Halorarum halophilum]|uniref:DUF7344 domain-containing protein n=1 Tax=Halorarum halophilum TaxID=2743090 RepID=A0A7D5GCG9_9EURY|nr:hypothetical protein [Halobaculum halophilum]QLG28212.1 hypothetical protein HUG10_11905 [Halobaculum halophilum]